MLIDVEPHQLREFAAAVSEKCQSITAMYLLSAANKIERLRAQNVGEDVRQEWALIPRPSTRVCVQTPPNAGKVFQAVAAHADDSGVYVRVNTVRNLGWFGLGLIAPAPPECGPGCGSSPANPEIHQPPQ